MYELIQVTERSCYIQCPAKIGLVRLEGDRVLLAGRAALFSTAELMLEGGES